MKDRRDNGDDGGSSMDASDKMIMGMNDSVIRLYQDERQVSTYASRQDSQI
jgi:hypothetical protein